MDCHYLAMHKNRLEMKFKSSHLLNLKLIDNDNANHVDDDDAFRYDDNKMTRKNNIQT